MRKTALVSLILAHCAGLRDTAWRIVCWWSLLSARPKSLSLYSTRRCWCRWRSRAASSHRYKAANRPLAASFDYYVWSQRFDGSGASAERRTPHELKAERSAAISPRANCLQNNTVSELCYYLCTTDDVIWNDITVITATVSCQHNRWCERDTPKGYCIGLG